jgi:hypothetical protein
LPQKKRRVAAPKHGGESRGHRDDPWTQRLGGVQEVGQTGEAGAYRDSLIHPPRGSSAASASKCAELERRDRQQRLVGEDRQRIPGGQQVGLLRRVLRLEEAAAGREAPIVAVVVRRENIGQSPGGQRSGPLAASLGREQRRRVHLHGRAELAPAGHRLGGAER